MSAAATAWDTFGAALDEAQRAAAEGRFGDFMTLGARLERTAAALPPPSPEQLPALRRQFARAFAVLSHIEAVRGALVSIRAEVSEPHRRRLLDQRG